MSIEENLDIRRRIEHITKTVVRDALMFQYVTASRVSEVVGKYAVHGDQCHLHDHEGEPLALFTINSAKKRGELRYVALPLNPVYEPWTGDLVKRFDRRGDRKVFPVSVRTVQSYAAKAFEGITYQIERYMKVKKHDRPLTTHGLRHIRATELTMYYMFDGIDLAVFCGWDLSQVNMPPTTKRYLMKQWWRCFPKLCKPLPKVNIKMSKNLVSGIHVDKHD